jgi:hypothetical protein
MDSQSSPNRYMFKDFYAKAPRFGAGFSKVLSSIKKPVEYESLFPKSSSQLALTSTTGVTGLNIGDDRAAKRKEKFTKTGGLASVHLKISKKRSDAVLKPIPPGKYDKSQEIVLPNAIRLAPVLKDDKKYI